MADKKILKEIIKEFGFKVNPQGNFQEFVQEISKFSESSKSGRWNSVSSFNHKLLWEHVKKKKKNFTQ